MALSRSVINISISSALRKTITIITRIVTGFIAHPLKHNTQVKSNSDTQKNDSKEEKSTLCTRPVRVQLFRENTFREC